MSVHRRVILLAYSLAIVCILERQEGKEMYEDSIYITIDIDWACDEVLEYTIDFLEQNKMKATFFVTHDTPLLKRLRESPLFELGIHPNFQYLLNGTSEYRDMQEALNAILETVPEAKSVRCHCLVQSSPLLDLFWQTGIRYDVNLFLPWSSGMPLKPLPHWNSLVRVPFFWEDDVQCIQGTAKGWDAEALLRLKGLKVFNFHPIHLFLNTECIKRYEKAKECQSDFERLGQFRFRSEGQVGAFAILRNIEKEARKQKKRFRQIMEIEDYAM